MTSLNDSIFINVVIIFLAYKDMTSVSDSVFSDGSVMRSASEYDREDSDDPLEEYETQYFGFTPKSFMNGGNDVNAKYIHHYTL
jgi:hypothetical protein